MKLKIFLLASSSVFAMQLQEDSKKVKPIVQEDLNNQLLNAIQWPDRYTIAQFKELLINGASPHGFDQYGNSILALSCKDDSNLERTKLLIQYGASLDAYDKKRCTPLCRSIQCLCLETVKFLLSQGADPNKPRYWSTKKDFMRPLSCAIHVGQNRIVSLLLKAGAKIYSAIPHLFDDFDDAVELLFSSYDLIGRNQSFDRYLMVEDLIFNANIASDPIPQNQITSLRCMALKNIHTHPNLLKILDSKTVEFCNHRHQLPDELFLPILVSNHDEKIANTIELVTEKIKEQRIHLMSILPLLSLKMSCKYLKEFAKLCPAQEKARIATALRQKTEINGNLSLMGSELYQASLKILQQRTDNAWQLLRIRKNNHCPFFYAFTKHYDDLKILFTLATIKDRVRYVTIKEIFGIY